jgi:sigma-B regulation protein RsbU (phosphoserine phosphatase)
VTLRRRFLVLSLTSLVVVIGIGIVLIVSFDNLRAGSRDVIAGITPGSEGAQAIHDLARVADWFALLLVLSTLVLIVWVAAITMGLRRDVLAPLRKLRSQLAAVTGGNFESPITPSGPPEIAEVGTDAEAMRRSLVTQIDGARAARDGLAQDTPLVAAINHELATPTDAAGAGYSLHGLRHAAEGVISGDWWDAVALPGGRTAIVVADATGHGPAAGIAALRVKTATRFLLADDVRPADVMTHLDRVFQDRDGRFVTLFLAVLDPHAGTCTWANAGHEPALLRRADGTHLELAATGPLVSMLSGEWEQRVDNFGAGDVLVAYSDGLAESRDTDGHQLKPSGMWSMLETAIAQHGTHASLVAGQIEVDARVRSASWATDDVTLLVVGPTS